VVNNGYFGCMDNINDIDAIIFDLDGTIYNKKRLQFFFTLAFFNKLSLMLSYLKIRKNNYGIDLGSKEKFQKKIIEELALKSSITKEKSEEFINSFMNKFVTILKQKYKPNNDIISVINKYHNKGVKLVCLSDYSKVKERLLALNIDINKFALIKSSEDYGTLKPASTPFIKIAEELNISPQKIVVVGDRKDTDGEGAKRSNMRFVKYPEEFNIFLNNE
jgi:FMN phosphatase YigB (HAD superfamily)